MSSGIFFLFMYKIVHTSGVFLMKNSTLRAIFIAFGTWKKCSTRYRTKPKKRLVPHFFLIILPEICTTKMVLNISRRYYDDLYQRIDRYHIGGKSTSRYRYIKYWKKLLKFRYFYIKSFRSLSYNKFIWKNMRFLFFFKYKYLSIIYVPV